MERVLWKGLMGGVLCRPYIVGSYPLSMVAYSFYDAIYINIVTRVPSPSTISILKRCIYIICRSINRLFDYRNGINIFWAIVLVFMPVFYY